MFKCQCISTLKNHQRTNICDDDILCFQTPPPPPPTHTPFSLSLSRCGSVVLDFMMRFNQSVIVNNILTVLSDAARQNKLGGFKVNPDSIKQVFLPTNGSESTVKGKFNKEIVNDIEVHKATRCIIRHGFMSLWFKD